MAYSANSRAEFRKFRIKTESQSGGNSRQPRFINRPEPTCVVFFERETSSRDLYPRSFV